MMKIISELRLSDVGNNDSVWTSFLALLSDFTNNIPMSLVIWKTCLDIIGPKIIFRIYRLSGLTILGFDAII